MRNCQGETTQMYVCNTVFCLLDESLHFSSAQQFGDLLTRLRSFVLMEFAPDMKRATGENVLESQVE